MPNRLFHRTGKIIAARSRPGTPDGFISTNPQYFDELPNATIIENLRFRFSVEKSVDREPNKCEIQITNLAPTTRVDLTTKPLIVTVLAGYDGNARYLFKGDLRFGYSKQEETEWTTILQLADGDRAFRHAQIHKSYRKGSSVVTALRDVVASMGLKLDSRLGSSAELQAGFASGRALTGSAAEELTQLLEPYGYRWSIQDGRMQILKDSEVREGEAFVINESTGMIGSPEYQVPEAPSTTKSGKPAARKGLKLRVKMLLYPELTPGAKVAVQSESVNGTFRIERVTHEGDTYDGDWTTEFEAKPL
jgi:hypothetical protein